MIRPLSTVLLLTATILAAAPVRAQTAPARPFVVNDYFGMRYQQEPVSLDVAFDAPVPADRLLLTHKAGTPRPWQVEIIDGTPAAVRAAKVWTLVDFEQPGQAIMSVSVSPTPVVRPDVPSPLRMTDGGSAGPVKLAVFSNGRFHARVPVLGDLPAGGAVRHELKFNPPVSALSIPGPVVSVSADGKTWVGSGYLDSMRRVEAITCEVEAGPVFLRSRITYRFEDGKTYVADVRLTANKPYASLNEDFNVGGDSRFIFNFDDYPIEQFLSPGDQSLVKWGKVAASKNPAEDFVTIEGQRCLARMVVWSQFNYFGGKQETLAVLPPMPRDEAIWTKLAAHEQKTDAGREELKARKAKGDEITAFEAQRRADRPSFSPQGLCVGAFYIRPDRWTRAKVNHVDLYARPEVPGDRMTRGVVGLRGSVERIAMEAWLVDGHREWAIFALDPIGRWEARVSVSKAPDGTSVRTVEPRFETDAFLAKAHVTEGVWPLDRIIRLPLVWNADGSPVAPEDTAPASGEMGFGGDISTVLKGTGGRAGLQHFNGSNGSMRGGFSNAGRRLFEWAKANPDQINARQLREAGQLGARMIGPAMAAYMAMDDSAYPGYRAMLPWTHPEALNPFYQGMENMNFNADRYNSVSAVGAALAAMNHPEGKKILMHGQEQMHMALDRYNYPESGCWEESHGYAAHTILNLNPLAKNLAANGLTNFFDDPRYARLYDWWCETLSPRDPGFGDMRLTPPIGDHGLNAKGPLKQFTDAMPLFAASKNPDVQRTARRMAWYLTQKGEAPVAGITPEAPPLNSRWVQGHGSILRAKDAKDRETYIVIRAGQSWGHHHMDKGSLWGWFRGVHFFGDAAWGGPPGATYGNSYKQGPASGTQIEFRGVTNWTLPCKYAAPWISDDQYDADFDYANARCMYPFNPRLDLAASTAVATRNGYDRQVLLVKPDLMIVRDNVDTVCPTIWRLHSYQVDGTKVEGALATLASPQGVTGRLQMLHPKGVSFTTTAVKDLLDGDAAGVGSPFGRAVGESDGKNPSPYDTRSMVLRWDMPANADATWFFGAFEASQAAPAGQTLDDLGRVVRVKLADGREITAFLNRDEFSFEGEGLRFVGTVGLAIREASGKLTLHPIRAKVLEKR